MDRDRLAELRRKKADNKANDHKQLLESNASIKEAINLLSEVINGKLDTSVISEQIKELKKSLTFSNEIKSLELSLTSIKSNPFKVKDFDKLLYKIGDINNTDVVEAVNNLIVKLQDNSQKAEDFQPVRRVIQIGNRLVFDDMPTPVALGGGGGGGGGFDGKLVLGNAKVSTDNPLPVAVEGDITIAGDVIVDNVGIENVDGDQVNPSTEEKQDDIISAINKSGDPKYGTSLALAQTASDTIVSYVAIAGDKLRGFVASGERGAFFELKIDSATILAGRIELGGQNSTVFLPISKVLSAGEVIDLDVTNTGEGSANYEGSIIIEN